MASSLKDLRMLVSLPYRERAAVAIMNQLDRQRIPYEVIETSLKKTSARDRTHDAVVRTVSVARSAVYLRKAANFLGNKQVALTAMHASKVLFDHATAKQQNDVQSLFGFPGACEQLFKSRPDAVKIFHSVDAHPKAHNAELLKHFSRSRCRAELYPDWLVERIERELDLADVILVPSNVVRDQMVTQGIPPIKLNLQPYGVDFDLFRPTVVEHPSPSERTPHAVYVGQISNRKGIPFLLEAVDSLPITLEMVGNVFDGSIVRSLPNNVTLTAPADHRELVRILGSADAFVIPTIEDACSLVALEAAASGLPVVTTRMNGAIEVLDPRLVTTVDEGSVDALRDMLSTLRRLTADERLENARIARESELRSWSDYADAVLGSPV